MIMKIRSLEFKYGCVCVHIERAKRKFRKERANQIVLNCAFFL